MTETRTVYLQPPRVLLEPCPMPPFEGDTVGDLEDWAVETREALEVCRSQVAALNWYYTTTTPSEAQ